MDGVSLKTRWRPTSIAVVIVVCVCMCVINCILPTYKGKSVCGERKTHPQGRFLFVDNTMIIFEMCQRKMCKMVFTQITIIFQ